MAIETRSTWGDLVKGISAQFAKVYNQAEESYSLAINDAIATPGNKYTSVFKTLTSDKAKERTAAKSGTGYLVMTPEGQAYASDSRIPGYTTTWTFQKFTNSVTVTEEEQDDTDYQGVLDEFADLTISAKETMDKNAFGLFNYAFTAQTGVPLFYSQYGDAMPLCSTVHPRRDGGTAQSNASATSIAFSEANLETARLALMNQLDDRGKAMRVGSGKLVLLVPPALEKTAAIVTKGEKRSGTANSDINIYDGMFTTIASKWISASMGGSDTAWFLIDPRVAKIVHWSRRALQPSRAIDNNTKNLTFYVSARWTDGYGDWRGVWGSQGNLVAYAI
jgi:hypothetical protein